MPAPLTSAWWTIGDQGATGACVGWAMCDSVLRWHFVKANKMAPTDALSVRFVWMAAKETDEFISEPTTFVETVGTSLKAALDISRKFGVVPDSALPFKSGALYQGDVQTFYALAARLKIAAYLNLGSDQEEWKKWIDSQGPILTRLEVDQTWNRAAETDGRLDAYDQQTANGGHAVALVGYSKDGFIVRNSWGTGWGDKGFAYVSSAYAAAAFTEAYGVSV